MSNPLNGPLMELETRANELEVEEEIGAFIKRTRRFGHLIELLQHVSLSVIGLLFASSFVRPTLGVLDNHLEPYVGAFSALLAASLVLSVVGFSALVVMRSRILTRLKVIQKRKNPPKPERRSQPASRKSASRK